MFVPSLITLVISCVAGYFSLNTQEEIVRVMATGTALVNLFLTLVLAPWLVLLILVVPVVGYRYGLMSR